MPQHDPSARRLRRARTAAVLRLGLLAASITAAFVLVASTVPSSPHELDDAGAALGPTAPLAFVTVGAVLTTALFPCPVLAAGERVRGLLETVGRRGFVAVLYARIVPGVPRGVANRGGRRAGGWRSSVPRCSYVSATDAPESSAAPVPSKLQSQQGGTRMTRPTLPPEPRASSISSALAVMGLMVVMGSLVTGIVLSTDALDVREGSRTMAWLFPAAIAGIGALLTAVILRFGSILASLRLRMDAMRDHLPALIDTNQKGN